MSAFSFPWASFPFFQSKKEFAYIVIYLEFVAYKTNCFIEWFIGFWKTSKRVIEIYSSILSVPLVAIRIKDHYNLDYSALQ